MFRSNSPLGNDASSYMGSIQSNGFSTMDEASSQVSSLSRPSARSIYLQRKEYASSINKMLDGFQYRVEHLFTCELDGRELRNLADCVERLKLLDGMGRVWGQSMLLEVKGTNLLLTDIETNEELESVALSDVLELKAVLDSGVFASLLTLSVQVRRKNITTVFMFQCEDVRADFVQKALSQVLSRRGEDPGISSNAGLMAGHVGRTNPRNAAKSSEPKEEKRAVTPVPQWTAPDYEEDDSIEPELFVPLEEGDEHDTMSTPRPYSELDRNVDILNHIVSDIEIFMGQIAAADAKNAKKKKKKKKKKTEGKAMDSMPPAAEFAACLQKIKFGFNLVAELKGNINNPSAPEFVHSLFASLAFVVSHCPEDLPPSIVAPLLTPQCLCLMSEEVSTEEEQLWQSLGDAWNIPRSKWPDDNEDILTYTLEFFDGWQPPEAFELVDPRNSVSRQESAHSQTSAKWTPPRSQQKARSSESTLLRPMCVMYDFVSRNNRELTVSKGEMVELLDMSKQWWKVRNRRGEEGYVPNNILEADDKQPFQQTGGSPVLTKKSKPAEVKAWLEDKGFSKITVRCLGVLSGSMLLGMAREELKTVCPEEGGRVFFQLQAVRSTMAADT